MASTALAKQHLFLTATAHLFTTTELQELSQAEFLRYSMKVCSAN